MKFRWDKLGGQLGVFFCVAGAVVMWAGWNGAASHDDVPSQLPYLISGGMAGLSLVVLGVGLFVTQAQREDRATLEANLTELRAAVDRLGLSAPSPGTPELPLLVAGPNAYHRPGCPLLEGKDGLPAVTVAAAEAGGLQPCRTCAAGA